MEKHIVFYDAKCPLCHSIKTVLKRLDWFNRIEWVAIQEAERRLDLYPYLIGKDVYDEIHMRTAKGEVKVGYYAIRRMLLALPVPALLALLLYIPYLDKVGSPLYKWFSAHRYEWFGRYETAKL
ncbi:hypothetical protein N781_14410 [Pontibacillus halophilus JSM 076056 = DSM 19796]|uniref:DUF393 domain-containing protein n=1 Tax=Pontibacillus halophilus JSM 076056 = DSM 19796 TaxID=1385510 RepID=A0A0A5I9P1_9BACI|nr:DUF393 domain-containing protein [Pontibacillus halophilus]KGX92532.1 hypothetical protein N781_14410 [Pontibacillus halophilus JSM 076056 = DSM 19796]